MNRASRAKKLPAPANGARHRATDRVIDILELAAASRDGLPLKALSLRVETPKSSLLPLLRTLSARGYLEQGRAGEYRLGPRALELAVRSRSGRDLAEVARPALEALMQRTGESAFLTTLAADAAAVVFIDVVESEQIIRYTVNVGQRSALHATANGKAILAVLPPAQRDEILRTLPLKRYTDRTLTSLPALRASLDEGRTAGVCVSLDEIVRGASGIAAPVYDRDGRVAGACAVGGPTERMKPRLRQLAADVKAAARSISMLLGQPTEPR
jgi:IclR family acetate operon transcriptional repressor